MKKLWLSLILILTAILLASCQRSEKIVGNGKQETIGRDVAAFKNVQVEGNYQVVIIGEMTQHVTLTADSNLLPYIMTNVHDSTLEIKSTQQNLTSQRPPLLEITVPSLEKITIIGNSEVNATRLDVDNLAIQINGSGKVNISGVAKHLDVTVSGAGEVNAQDLKTDEANIKATGAPRVGINAQKYLNVKLSGNGLVEYYGTPAKIDRNISGSGKIIGISGHVKKNSN